MVKYTHKRSITTLHGAKTARIKVLTCKNHPNERISIHDATKAPVIPKCRTDMDVIILIGLLRWRLKMKRYEIQSFLRARGISLSTGSISNRSLDFLLLFKQLHNAKKNEIKALINRKGGMILHIDGTHRSGGRVVFVLQEGLEDIVIDADLIPSEAEDHVNPILSKFKEVYGSPLVVVRDMAQGLRLSISNTFPKTPQQICQVHFIRNLEKDLVTEYHKRLKSFIVKHKLTSRLRALQKIKMDSDDDMENLEHCWIRVAVDYLLYPIEKRIKWISRPISYVVQYYRIKEVSNLVSRLISWNTSNNVVHESLMGLDECLRSILDDSEVLYYYSILDKTLEWLDELRDNLRISRKTNLKDFSSEDIEVEGVLKSIRELLNRISEEGQKPGGQYMKTASSINDAFESHWDELFVPNPIVNGKQVMFRRHNNGLESSHRRIRKAIRERTGRSETNQGMEQFGDLPAILSNLWNKTYQKEILHDVEYLGHSLSAFINDLPELRKEYHEAIKGSELPIADEKRMGVLEDFVQVLESSKSPGELVCALQSILGAEVSVEAVC
jgi:hypothetical protein